MNLPTTLNLEILAYLCLHDIFLKAALVSTRFNKLVKHSALLNALLTREVRLDQPRLDVATCVELLKCNSSSFKRTDRPLSFYGFATNGGICASENKAWLRIFNDHEKYGYTAKAESLNVNCAAVLECTMRSSILDRAYRLLKRIERKLEQTIPVDQSRASIMNYLRIYERICGTLDQSAHKRKCKAFYAALAKGRMPRQPTKLIFADVSALLLCERLNFQAAELSQHFACIYGLRIMRDASYHKYPVATMVVFCSDTVVPVDSPEFSKFNDLASPEMVRHTHELDAAVPGFDGVVDSDSCSFLEFKASSSALRPVIWLKFRPGVEEVTVVLSRCFCCKFLYIKLIDFEERLGFFIQQHRKSIHIGSVVALGRMFPTAGLALGGLV
jgi:hypothetical protein